MFQEMKVDRKYETKKPENISLQLLVTKKPMISTQNVSLAIKLADFCVPSIWLGPVVQLSMGWMIASQKQQLS